MMTKLAKLACPLAIAAALAFASGPANAQFGGMDMSQMQQMAPMLEMMKKQMGKRRFGQMMQMMAPMMAQMGGQGGFSGMPGGLAMPGGVDSASFGGGMPMMGGGMDMGQMMGMMR